MADDALLTLIAGSLGIAPSEVDDASDFSNTRNWDSMRQIMLMTELESHYNIVLPDSQIMETNSVVKIRSVLSTLGLS